MTTAEPSADRSETPRPTVARQPASRKPRAGDERRSDASPVFLPFPDVSVKAAGEKPRRSEASLPLHAKY
jgi:hypothetical protein